MTHPLEKFWMAETLKHKMENKIFTSQDLLTFPTSLPCAWSGRGAVKQTAWGCGSLWVFRPSISPVVRVT